MRPTSTVASELPLHGRPEEARGLAEAVVAELRTWPDLIRALSGTQEVPYSALRTLRRHPEVVRSYEKQSRGARAAGAASAAGLQYRVLGMRARIFVGDTAGALALVDSART